MNHHGQEALLGTTGFNDSLLRSVIENLGVSNTAALASSAEGCGTRLLTVARTIFSATESAQLMESMDCSGQCCLSVF